MPGIHIPFPFRRQQATGRSELVLASADLLKVAPPPPLTHDDPRLRAFLGVTFDVLYDWDIRTGAIYFSERIDDLLGLEPGAFPRNLEGWLGRIHPDDHEKAGEALWESVTDLRPFRCEYRLRHEDGSYRTVEDQGVILAAPGSEPANMIGAMRDVTAEREAQLAMREASELHRVLFRLPSPAMLVNADGVYVDADDHALAFFERSMSEMRAARVRDDFPEEVVALLDGADGTAIADLTVTCTVHGKAKAMLLNIIPTDLGNERSHFLLGADITEQRAMQEELARSERALRRQATILDERNAALRVLLEQREQDRRELEQRVVQNVEQLIEPTLDRLSRTLRHQPERFELEAVRANLREIVGPFAQRIGGSGMQPLTRRETEVANLVRLGHTSAEIAAALHISASAVAFHRANIREKLGLPKRGPHLATHLAAMGRD